MKKGEEPSLDVSLQRQVGVSIQDTFAWMDSTSSQGVVESLPSGSMPPQNVDVSSSGAAIPSSSHGEPRSVRGFMRHRSVKALRSEKIENGELRTWEWKGTVSNSGIKIGGCSTEVLVINVSGFYFSSIASWSTDGGFIIGLFRVLREVQTAEWTGLGVPPCSTNRDGL